MPWLMKSEPDTYSIENLKKDGSTAWTGVRNYQARNFMMNEMKVGDGVLFYHSSAEPPGVAGLAKVSKAAIPDPSQFDKKSPGYDPKASKEKPIWFCVEIEYVKTLKNFLPLQALRDEPKLSRLPLLQKGQRLSVQPVDKAEFDLIKKMGGV